MKSEADQQDTAAQGGEPGVAGVLDPATAESPATGAEEAAGAAAGLSESGPAAPAGAFPAAAKAAKRQPGVPVWRTGKPDAFLAVAVDTARAAIEGITAPRDIGQHLAAKSEGDRLVTHLFECRLPGYLGWQWFAVLTRNSRSKVVTVSELGLLPSEGSILAPDWVPWAERVRPEDEQEQEPAAHGTSADPAPQDLATEEPAGEPEPTDHDAIS